MKLTRVFLALVLMFSMVTPSLAAICASTCAMGCEDMGKMQISIDVDKDSQTASAPTGPCHNSDTSSKQNHDSGAKACPMAAVCALAGSCPLTPMSSAVPYSSPSSYFAAVNLHPQSIDLPLPIEPPIV